MRLLCAVLAFALGGIGAMGMHSSKILRVHRHPVGNEAVVLVHGLGRTSSSMWLMQKRLAQLGYHVVNLEYPSTQIEIEKTAREYLQPQVEELSRRFDVINFVTHSMGGIVVRQYLEDGGSDTVGRIVMLAPPNKGSEIIDRLGGYSCFKKAMGPASLQLSTISNSLPNRLGGAKVKVGIIAGSLSLNPLSSLMIEGPDDGKVSVESTRLEGMTSHLVVSSSHTFMMNNPAVTDRVISFLQRGTFDM